MKAAGYEVRYYQKIESVKLNEDFAYFLGLLITDGHLQIDNEKKRYNTMLYTSYSEERVMIKKLIKELFGYKSPHRSRLYGFAKRINYEIRISSKYLSMALNKQFGVPYGEKSFFIEVPKIIAKGNRLYKMAFLRGVIDGDGSIGKNSIKISSGSINFLQGSCQVRDVRTR